MMRFFIRHELVTQFRSLRFRGLSLAYVVTASAAPVLVFASRSRVHEMLGPGGYDTILLMSHPLLTSFLGAGLAIDSIARERDEGSFSVLSVCPMSSAGYVLRRWLAVVAVCLPISVIPTIVTAALSIRSAATLPLVWMFAAAWLVHVLPALLASSAFAIALGTITGRTVFAIIAGLLILTFGIGELDEILFHVARITFGGIGDVFGFDVFHLQRLLWLVRGYGFFELPSDAGFPLRSLLREMPMRIGISGAVIAVSLGASAFYLRRTRRDLRPWNIRDTHPLRTIIGVFNRTRQEFAPDSGSTLADRATLAVTCAIAVALIANLVHRTKNFAQLAASRYVAETVEAKGTDSSVVADAVVIDAALSRGGAVQSSATVSIRNRGAAPQARLSFDLNPLLSVRRAGAARGRLRMHRVWQRLDVDLEPPLAAGESRGLTFEVEGIPGEVDFALQSPGLFPERWQRYTSATKSIYFTDLSRSTVDPAATEVRAELRASDLAPVIRYSPWKLQAGSNEEGFVPESVLTPSDVRVRLRHPYSVALDSCGAMSDSLLQSRCTTPLPAFAIFGGFFARRSIGPRVALTYIPAHEEVARAHVPSFAAAVGLAAEAWPGLQLPARVVFAERPREPGREGWYSESSPLRTVREIAASGSVIRLPEALFTRPKLIDPNVLAAAILSATLRDKRPVVSSETLLFNNLYAAVAVGRMGMRRMRATVLAGGAPPATSPLVNVWWSDARLTRVLLDIEYRVGATHFLEGVQDFIGATGAGTSKELLEAIGRRGGVDLSRAYTDYFTGNALPELTLEDVTFTRAGDRWLVKGAVRNQATGLAFAPVALRTAGGPIWQTVRVDSHERVPFSFTAEAEPRAVQLDPDQVCYRFAAVGTTEVVENRGTP